MLKRSRPFFGYILASAALCLDAACTGVTDESSNDGAGAIVNVPHTDVEKQSIGNCWAYAHTSWAESMHKAATGKDVDLSETYLTYWSWFEQIRASAEVDRITTGGTWRIANDLVRSYGVLEEKAFVLDDPSEAGASRSIRALNAMNASLSEGALSSAEARKNLALVRAELDRAWELQSSHKATLDGVFGKDGKRTLLNAGAASTAPIVRAADFVVAYAQSPGASPKVRSLEAAMNEWQIVRFGDRIDDRSFWLRVQHALHASSPVLISWLVDYNAFEREPGALRGSFSLKTLERQGPGRQLVHVTLLQDYQARLADGTLLEAGVTLDPTKQDDKVKLERALEPSSRIEFVRVKNSWGTTGDGSVHAPGLPGYHDLYLDYLQGPIARCEPSILGGIDTSSCTKKEAPLRYVLLPPGF
jgi:hypothetical protein